MSHHPTDFVGDVKLAIKQAVEGAIAGCTCDVTGGGGHFEIVATSAAFAGQSLLNKQRMVLNAIAHLMKGDAAPVHAVDKIETRTP
jgi:acid stress-induced BolA-like protein IbaG/YrbA